MLKMVGLIVAVGLATSLIVFFRPEAAGEIDLFLLFLIVAYPFLIGATVYFYLKDQRTGVTLQEEYYIKWYLQSYAKLCLSENDLQVMREELAGTLLRLIKPVLVSVYEFNEETKRLEVVHHAGMKNLPETATQGYAFGEGIPGWVIQNQNPVILADISKEQYLQVDPWAKTIELKSYAAVPIIFDGKPIGIVAMYSMEPNFFQDSNVLIAQLATQLYGLSLSRLQTAAQSVDALTPP